MSLTVVLLVIFCIVVSSDERRPKECKERLALLRSVGACERLLDEGIELSKRTQPIAIGVCFGPATAQSFPALRRLLCHRLHDANKIMEFRGSSAVYRTQLSS